MPGDTIQFVDGSILINNKKILRKKIKSEKVIRCGNFLLETNTYIEILPNGVEHIVVYKKKAPYKIRKYLKFL